ncbi:hypothetical protein G6F23_015038 [Rhizopus arrhizus]|nr:hypothetical protein G6F23_015038 [Rhizopus arrhizus]
MAPGTAGRNGGAHQPAAACTGLPDRPGHRRRWPECRRSACRQPGPGPGAPASAGGHRRRGNVLDAGGAALRRARRGFAVPAARRPGGAGRLP